MSHSPTPRPENICYLPQLPTLQILDQSLLPLTRRMVQLSSIDDCFEAIASLRVRGAPAIGIFAACALAYLIKGERDVQGDLSALRQRLVQLAARLESARPTAVNLSTMLRRMLARAESCSALCPADLFAALDEEALSIQEEDIAMCRSIAEQGLALLPRGAQLLTHCNAGPLATSCYGTALGPILLGQERGYDFHVYCDETRPLLQGARLTSYELTQAGVPCTLICDNMAASLMQAGKIDAVLVGCDRVARNGDTANKIGTLGLAVLCKHFGIPFYVLGPSSTLDFSCPSGAEIPIEERNGAELRALFFAEPVALPEVACYNPAFDVTPACLIRAIVTERGLAQAPFAQSLAELFPSLAQ